MKLLLDCRDLSRLLSQSQDSVPTLTRRARIRMHLMTCRACSNVDEQLRFVRVAVRKLEGMPAAVPAVPADGVRA